jgi:hypothetical protein
MNKQYIYVLLGLLTVAVAFQNCSGTQFNTGSANSTGLSTDATSNRSPSSVQEAPSAIDRVALDLPSTSAGSSSSASSSDNSAAQPQVQTACECEFDLNSYFNQGYTTTFYVTSDGKSYYPNRQTGKMRLPGNMTNQFNLSKGNSLIVFSCKKGLLSSWTYDFDAGTSSASGARIAIAPDCPNIECRFKLQNGFTTTFATSKSGKTYSPDAQGNMSLPGDFNPYQLNTWNAAGDMIYYRCEKGILTTMDSQLRVQSVEAAY